MFCNFWTLWMSICTCAKSFFKFALCTQALDNETFLKNPLNSKINFKKMMYTYLNVCTRSNFGRKEIKRFFPFILLVLFRDGDWGLRCTEKEEAMCGKRWGSQELAVRWRQSAPVQKEPTPLTVWELLTWQKDDKRARIAGRFNADAPYILESESNRVLLTPEVALAFSYKSIH